MQKLRPEPGIGKNIRYLRLKNEMKQDDVVGRLNLMDVPITRSTYAKIETNRMNIKISELMALKEVFKAGYEDLFERDINSDKEKGKDSDKDNDNGKNDE